MTHYLVVPFVQSSIYRLEIITNEIGPIVQHIQTAE